MDEIAEQTRRAREVDIVPLVDNQIPLWLVVRALAKLGVIKRDTFLTAVREVINDELGVYGEGTPEPGFVDQLERCYDLIHFNADPDPHATEETPPPKPKRTTKGTPAK
jgi:hypothetical protein